MADTISKEQRHNNMSKIRSKDTKIEIQVRHWLYHHGIRYRKNCKDIPGKPDIAIKKYKIAIFVNGCFWHGHEGCKYYRVPKTRVDYWKPKIESNKLRDEKAYRVLNENGWHVFVLWGCKIQSEFEETMDILAKDICEIIKKHEREML